MKNKDDYLILLLSEFIKKRSITPYDNGLILKIEEILKELKFQTNIIESNGSRSIYAKIHKNDKNICFCGHVDVVKEGEGWLTDPFIATIKEDKIFGRGVVDMKGAIASFISAIKESELKTSVSILLTSDEESSSENGMIVMRDWLIKNKEKIDLIIVGEPTSENTVCDTIKIGRRGSITFNLKIEGKQGHVAYKGENPITHMIEVLHDLKKERLDEGNEYFEPSNMEIVSINNSDYSENMVPQYSSSIFNIRFNNNYTIDSLYEKIIKIIKKRNYKYYISHKVNAVPFLSEIDQNLLSVIKQSIKEKADVNPVLSTSGGTSDARFLYDIYKVIEIGLKNSYAHKSNENCDIEDLFKLKNIYKKILEDIAHHI